MANVFLYSGISIDFYIARSDGSIDWLDSPEYIIEGEDFGYHSFFKNIGITVMGNSTYTQMMGFDVPFPYPDQKNFVISRSPGEDTEYIEYVREDPLKFLKNLKAQAEKDIWIVGGGEIDSMALNAGIVDTMILTILPIVLGSGIRFFQGETIEQKFRLESCKSFPNGFVQLEYRKRNSK